MTQVKMNVLVDAIHQVTSASRMKVGHHYDK